jgi:parallel beta-helix repeat protein
MKMRIICVLFLLLFAGFVQSAVTYDTNSSGALTHGVSLTIAHTTTSSANRLMLVGVTWADSGTLVSNRCNICAENGEFYGCTYGGVALDDFKVTNNVHVLKLYAPAVGTNDLICTWSTSCHVDATVGATTFSGVSQTAGLGIAVDASGSTSPITTAITGGSADNLLWDSVGVLRYTTAMTITEATEQTMRWNRKAGGDKCSPYPLSGGSTKAGLVGATTLNWTESTAKNWWSVAVEVKQYVAPPDTTPPNVSIVSPTVNQNTWGNLLINATVNDTGGLNASLVFYRITNSTTNVTGWVNMTNTTFNSFNATFNTVPFPNGWYNVTINATDNAGNQNASVNRSFYINNSMCGTITTSTTLYNNLTSSGTCITFGASNIVLDCNGFNISGDGTENGIEAITKDNITVKNCNVWNYERAVYFEAISNSFINNITASNNAYIGIYLYDSSNNSFSNIITNENGNSGIEIDTNSNNNLITNYTTSLNVLQGIYIYANSNSNILSNVTANGNDYGVLFETSLNNTISNSTITGSTTGDIFSDSNAQNNVLLNVSFDSSRVGWGAIGCAPCNLTVKWYGRVNVTNTTDPLPANVNVSDKNGRSAFSNTAGADGLTSWFVVTDYIATSTSNTTFNNHTINASYAGYSINSTSYNFTARDETVNLTLYLVKIYYPPGRRWWNDTAIVEASGVYEDEDRKPGFSWLPVLASGGGLLWLTVFGRPAA